MIALGWSFQVIGEVKSHLIATETVGVRAQASYGEPTTSFYPDRKEAQSERQWTKPDSSLSFGTTTILFFV